jgi:predicted nucleotidyltransferase
MTDKTQLDTRILIEIAKRYRVIFLGLFGSYARDQAKDGSDIDVYVRFGRPVALFEVLSMKHDMEDATGLQVDLIAEEAVTLYDSVRKGIERDLIVLFRDEQEEHAIAQ